MFRRLIIGVFSALLGLVVVALVGIAVLMRTGPGQSYIASLALPKLEKAIGLRVEFAQVGGAWPGEFAFKNLVLADAEGIWLEAESVRMVWSPLSFLDKHVAIDSVILSNGVWHRVPKLGGAKKAESTQKPSSSTPLITIEHIQLDRVQISEEIIGQDLVLDLAGDLELKDGKTIAAHIDANIDAPESLSQNVRKLLGGGVRLETDLSGNVKAELAFDQLRLSTRDRRLVVSGDGRYDISSQGIAAQLEAVIASSFITELEPHITPESPINLSAIVSGTTKNLNIKSVGDAHDLMVWENALSAVALTSDVHLTKGQLRGEAAVEITSPDYEHPLIAQTPIEIDFAERVSLLGYRVTWGDIALNGNFNLNLAEGQGQMDLTFDVPSLATLPVDADLSGAVEGALKVNFGAGTPNFKLSVHSESLTAAGVAVDGLKVMADGALNAPNFKVRADLVAHPSAGVVQAVALAGGFTSADNARVIDITQVQLDLDGSTLDLIAPTKLTLADQSLSLSEFDIVWGDFGQFMGQAELSGDDMRLDLRIAGFEPSKVPGIISGVVAIDTTKAQAGALALEIIPTTLNSADVAIDIEGNWDGETLRLVSGLEGRGDDVALDRIELAHVQLPLQVARALGKTSVNLDGPIEGTIQYEGDLTPFLALMPLSNQDVSGKANIDFKISGDLKKPVLSGRAQLRDGFYEHVDAGVLLRQINIDLEARQASDAYVIDIKLTAADSASNGNATPISGDGQILFGDGAPSITSTLRLNHAQILAREDVSAILSGEIEAQGPMDDLSIEGQIDILHAEIQIPDEVANGSTPEIEVVEVDAHWQPIVPLEDLEKTEPSFAANLDVRVRAPEQIFIRGKGLESEWAINLDITGTNANPRIAGQATVRRGRFDFSGRRFDLRHGIIGFVPGRTSDPDLDIEAENDTGDVVAVINVRGRASAPQIKLSSEPALPEEDVMSLVLFGKPAQELSALEAVRLAEAVARLTGAGPLGGGGPGILDRARSSLGLDLLDVQLNGAQPAVTVGKYVREGVFVSATPGLAGEPGSVSVEVEINRWLSVETDVGQDADSSVGVNWKRDY